MDMQTHRRPDDNLALMTWHARPDTSCEYVNRAWLDYTGYTLEQALGEGWVRCLHPEDLARWLDACVRAFDERRPFEIEYRLRRRDGEYRWVLDRAAPRFAGNAANGGGLFLGYAGVCIDIDEYKRLVGDNPSLQTFMKTGSEGYPPDLETLVKGLDTGELKQRKIKFLRRIPIDPMTGEANWIIRSNTQDRNVEFWDRMHVFDVRSRSRGTALDGTKYADW